MTVQNVPFTQRVGPGDGVTTAFTFNIPVLDKSYIYVQLITRATGVVKSTLNQGSDTNQCQVTVAKDFKSFNLTLGATAAAAYDANTDMRVYRATPVAQSQPFPYDNNVPPKTQERIFDRVFMVLQEFAGQLSKALTLAPETPATFSTVISGTPVAGSVPKVKMDSSGNPIGMTWSNYDVDTNIGNLQAYASSVSQVQVLVTTATAAAASAVAAAGAVAAPLPYVSLKAEGFDLTGVTANGAKFNALFTKYPNGFTAIVDVPGGILLLGDVPIDDGGKQYEVLFTAGSRIKMSANNNDHIRTRGNDIAWRGFYVDGSNVDHTVYNPTLFVMGYASGTGGAGRNLQVSGTIFNTPGTVFDCVQGNGAHFTIRGGGGWGPLFYGRSATNDTGNYKGGNDLQNWRLDVQVSSWKNWVMTYNSGSSLGSHQFIFWKQYSCYNGIRVAIAGNDGRIYSERVSQDWNGVPWYCEDPSGNTILFEGALDDSDWLVNDYVTTDGNGLTNEYARGMRSSQYLSTQDGYGLLWSRLASMEFEIYARQFSGALRMYMSAGNEITMLGLLSSNAIKLVMKHANAVGGAHLKLFTDYLGFAADLTSEVGGGRAPFLINRFTHAEPNVTHLATSSDNLAANGSFSRTVTSGYPTGPTYPQIDNIKVNDALIVTPRFDLPDGVILKAYCKTAGQVVLTLQNTKPTAIPGPIAGVYNISALGVVQ